MVCDYVRRYFSFDGLEFNDSVAAGVEDLLNNPQFGTAFFLLDNGVRAGYAVLTHGFDHEFGGRIAILTDFFLDEPFRGRGLGTLAIDLLVEHARVSGAKAFELFVLHHNNRAKRLYEKAGFKLAEDRVAMVRVFEN
jgi:ribosomal protein S18 acetylase RimI-like enzyme